MAGGVGACSEVCGCADIEGFFGCGCASIEGVWVVKRRQGSKSAGTEVKIACD